MATKAEKLLAKGRKLEAKGKTEQALEQYRKAAELDAYDPEVWVLVGEASIALGENAAATDALFRAADLLFRGGVLEEALRLARRVLEIDAGHGGARLFVRKLEPRVRAKRGEPEPIEASAFKPPEPEPVPAAPRRESKSHTVSAGEGEGRERAATAGSMRDLESPIRDSHRSLPSIIIDPDLENAPVPADDERTVDLPKTATVAPAAEPEPEPEQPPRNRRPSLTDMLVSMVAEEPETDAAADADAMREFDDAPDTKPMLPRVSEAVLRGQAEDANPTPIPNPVPFPIRNPDPVPRTREPRARRYSGPIEMPPLDADALTPEMLSLADYLPADSVASNPEGTSDIPLDDEPARETMRASASSLAGSALVSELDKELVDRLYDAGSFAQFRAGKDVFQQGDRGTSLYIIQRGQVDVIRKTPSGEARLATLRPGAFFGEMSLLTNLPRTATVRARTDLLLLEIARKEVRALLARDASILKLLMRFFRARLVGTLLEISPLFGGFTREEKKDLVRRFRLREVGGNRQLISEGEPVEGLYLVLAGNLDVERAGELIAELGAGDVIGEISLLYQGGATANVWTSTRSWLLLLPREEFRSLIQTHAAVREHLVKVATERRAPIDGSRLEPV